MKINLYDIIIAVIVILVLIAVLTLVKQREEPFTALYFKDHEQLPMYRGEGSFIFVIENHENRDVLYDVKIILEGANETIPLKDFSLYMPASSMKQFNVSYKIPDDFGKARLTVRLENQSIHFWTYSENRTI